MRLPTRLAQWHCCVQRQEEQEIPPQAHIRNDQNQSGVRLQPRHRAVLLLGAMRHRVRGRTRAQVR